MNPLDAPESTSLPAVSLPGATPVPLKKDPQSITEFKPEDAAAAVARLERLLREVRGALDAREREHEHQEFSVVRLLGAVVQMCAIGMLTWAAIDCYMQPLMDQALVKAVFAGVLQLMALTTFLVSRPRA